MESVSTQQRDKKKDDPAKKVKPRATVVRKLTKAAAPKNVRQKNVVSVGQLKNGSTLTTLKGGRKIQQVQGKSAYVVAKGEGKPSALAKQPNGTAAARKALAARNKATAARVKKK